MAISSKIVLTSLLLTFLIGAGVYTVIKKLDHFAGINEIEDFHSRLHKIADAVNSSGSSWSAKVHERWHNFNDHNIDSQMGWITDHASEHKNLLSAPVSHAQKELPKSFDAREKWGHRCPSLFEIRDQAKCGSCWAFAAAETLTDRVCIHTGDDVRLSSQNILSCCASCGDGCNGGWIEAAMWYFVDVGLVTGDLYQDTKWCQAYTFPPNTPDSGSGDLHAPAPSNLLQDEPKIDITPQCVKHCDSNSTYPYPYEEDLYKGSHAYGITADERAIMTDLINNGPIEVGLTVYEDLLTYKSGVYQHLTGKLRGGHAVKLIGWGEENGIPYWTIVNSWNTFWGDNGTFKILRGSNECGIESACYAAIPEKKIRNKQQQQQQQQPLLSAY